jgi:hypothetical protein
MIQSKVNINIIAILVISLSIVLSACSRDDVAEKWAEEENDLYNWMRENEPGLRPLKNGVYVKITGERQLENMKPETTDHVMVNFVCRFFDDETIEQTSYMQWDIEPLYLPAYKHGGPELWEFLRWGKIGIDQMHKGESAKIYVPSRALNLQDFRTRVYDIELVDVIENIGTYQDKMITNFFRASYPNGKIDSIKITIDGRQQFIVYHIDDDGFGSELPFASVRTRFNEYFILNRDFQLSMDNISRSGRYWASNFADMLQPARRGRKVTALMPVKVIYHEGFLLDENRTQYIVPPGSVLRYEIEIER